MDAHALVDRRLWKRAIVSLSVGTVYCGALAACDSITSSWWRAAAVIVPELLFILLAACITPGTSDTDLRSDETFRFYGSALAAGCAWTSQLVSLDHPCGSMTLLPGLGICVAYSCAIWLGDWTGCRAACVISGVLQLARTAAQAYAQPLAEAAAARGVSGLLPMASACQATGLFLPGWLTSSGAVGFGLSLTIQGLALTPDTHRRLAALSGSFGMPACCVLHLNDGVVLNERERNDPEMSAPAEDCCSDSQGSSGPFASSLWSGWSASWSDAGKLTPKERMRRHLGGLNMLPRDLALMQCIVQRAKKELAEEDARKAMRRASHHGKAYGKLVWLLLRRAQRHGKGPFSALPRDALRIIVSAVAEDEAARLRYLYAARLATGALSYRG